MNCVEASASMRLEMREETYDSGSVNVASLRGGNEDEDKRWDEGDSIAAEQILPLQSAEFLCAVPMEEGEVDIDCHGQGP